MRSGYELFRFHGVAVRLHGSFALLALLMGVLALAGGGSPLMVGLRLLAPIILFATVLLHELGHALCAQRLGVTVVDVVLTPLGGMARIQGAIENPRHEVAIAAAGPASNLAVAGLLAAIVVLAGRSGELDLRELALLESESGLLGADPLLIALSFNLLLGVVNLVPAFPMDGGRIFRGLLAMRVGRLQATRTACRLGLFLSLAIILLPFFLPGSQWWILVFIGVFLAAAGIRERVVVEAREGFFKGGLRGFRMRTTGGPFGFPPDGAGAPGGDAGPAAWRDEHGEAEADVIDVPGESRVIKDDSKDGR